MNDCCALERKTEALVAAHHRATLKAVLALNAAMFAIEIGAGLLAHSTALLADSLDMLGDALVYGLSLYAVGRGAHWKARAAWVKGTVMGAFGLLVLAQAAGKMLFPVLPVVEAIAAVGALALAVNALCLGLLWRHRRDDLNMQSVWLCSRNDIIANLSVLFAAAFVQLTQSGWPDILIGLAIAVLFLRSAYSVLQQATAELRLSEA